MEDLLSFLYRSLSSLTITMHNRRNPFLEMLSSLIISFTLLLLSLPTSTSADTHPPPSDASALLAFKSTADPHYKLHFSLNNRFDHCQWEGVKCSQQRKAIRFVLQGLNLGGVFGSNTLSRLDQLRLLSLQNNSLTGLIPDLSGLVNLKTLFLNHNSFSGSFPPSILSLHRLRTLDLSYNNFTGSIPTGLTGLDPLYYLRLEWNRFNGTIPPLNQSSLEIFNVSGNNLTGAIPITIVFMRIDVSSFSWNPFLCGEIIQKQCLSAARPFFGSFSPISPPVGETNGQSEQLQGLVLPPPSNSSLKTQKKTHLIIGFSIAILLLIGSIISVLLGIRKKSKQKRVLIPPKIDPESFSFSTSGGDGGANAVVMRVEEEEKELEAKVKKMQGMQLAKSGSLVFCAGEAQVYSLDQLMRASAEMLGRGSIGSTYKALLDNQMIVSVKRLDAVKTAITNKEMFERQMESVGSLRHPNLVPLRAYFQAKEERLIVYDYQPNGSLFSLIHGSRSARAKPLHWTSCLKIAEDVAQGLAYIHQTSRLIHGNLKSSNVLLGADFEACVTDYCLSVLSDSIDEDPDSAAYKAPETRKSNRRATTKSDAYAFGILLLELITGKPPSQHPFIVPMELSSWVRSVREVEVGEENRLGMLLEVAITCSLMSPEQRPTMWQVMKMIQEIKEAVMIEDSQLFESTGFS